MELESDEQLRWILFFFLHFFFFWEREIVRLVSGGIFEGMGLCYFWIDDGRKRRVPPKFERLPPFSFLFLLSFSEERE